MALVITWLTSHRTLLRDYPDIMRVEEDVDPLDTHPYHNVALERYLYGPMRCNPPADASSVEICDPIHSIIQGTKARSVEEVRAAVETAFDTRVLIFEKAHAMIEMWLAENEPYKMRPYPRMPFGTGQTAHPNTYPSASPQLTSRARRRIP